jgi:thiosulfate/3-mercaptopyruvate sulfurtransferase
MTGNIVSPAWLSESLLDPRLIILDASWHMPATGRSGSEEFGHRRLPGARFFDIDEISDSNTDLPHMLPAADDFARAVAALGIGQDTHVVIYDALGLFSAPRAWWMFKVFGHPFVSVLAGGMPAWRQSGFAIETTPPAHPPGGGDFTGERDATWIADMAQVEAALASGDAVVLDARSADRFSGAQPEPRPGLPSGHMPRAKSLPFQQVLDPQGSNLRPSPELASLFATCGITPTTPVITSCGSGVSACILGLALAEIGIKPRIYDGSWCEWASRQPAHQIAIGQNP